MIRASLRIKDKRKSSHDFLALDSFVLIFLSPFTFPLSPFLCLFTSSPTPAEY
jgi:hypothetical protein